MIYIQPRLPKFFLLFTELALAHFAFQFLRVLNSKKAKLRELRNKLSKQGASGKLEEEEEEVSTDKTESFDDRSDDEKSEEELSKDFPSSSKNIVASRPRGRKRK